MAPPDIRVAVCDDHKSFAQGLSALLSQQPHVEVVGTAATVAELMELVSSARPNAVLLDHVLPDGDGATATRALKELDPQLDVIILTSYADPSTVLATLRAGCSGYLTKHKGIDVIANSLRMAAAGEAVISTSLLRAVVSQLRPLGGGGPDLTPRELEILELIVDGKSNLEIAARLYVSLNTVRNHVQRILKKMGVHSRLEAAAVAVREHYVNRM